MYFSILGVGFAWKLCETAAVLSLHVRSRITFYSHLPFLVLLRHTSAQKARSPVCFFAFSHRTNINISTIQKAEYWRSRTNSTHRKTEWLRENKHQLHHSCCRRNRLDPRSTSQERPESTPPRSSSYRSSSQIKPDHGVATSSTEFHQRFAITSTDQHSTRAMGTTSSSGTPHRHQTRFSSRAIRYVMRRG